MLLPGIVLVGVCGEFVLVRWSLISFGLPLLNVHFLRVMLSRGSCAFGISVSINGVSDPLSDSITVARFCVDDDLVNRPSGPRGPIPLLLYSCLKSAIGLLITFLCYTLPLRGVNVWFVPDMANCDLSEYALSNLLRWCFFSRNKNGKLLTPLCFFSVSLAAGQTHCQVN